MNENHQNLVAAIEAILFVYGEPIALKRLAKMTGREESEIIESLRYLEDKLKMEERGLCLVHHEDKVQLTTKPHFKILIETIAKEEFEEDLTPAALETLAIVMYSGPISRIDVEYIRGVNSSFILRNLLMRGLVERAIDPKRANAYVYSTSFELLKHVGLPRIEALPEYEHYHGLIQKLYTETKKTDLPHEQTKSA